MIIERTETEVVQGAVAVDFGAGDVAFFDPQNIHRVEAVGDNTERFAGLQQAVPAFL